MDKCPTCGCPHIGIWGKTSKISYIAETETEITRLKALVREMGELLRYRSDGAAHKVLTNPEVRAIMEEENESIMLYDNSDSKP